MSVNGDLEKQEYYCGKKTIPFKTYKGFRGIGEFKHTTTKYHTLHYQMKQNEKYNSHGLYNHYEVINEE